MEFIFSKKLYLIFFLLCLSLYPPDTLGPSAPFHECFLPHNDLMIPEGKNHSFSLGVTQDDYLSVIEKIQNIYGPIVKERGAKLVIEKNWENPKVNALAKREGRTWKAIIFGGLARHESMTADGLALIVCHEIGHHLGGSPITFGPGSFPGSNEGQADYFATLKCLRRVWEKDSNEEVVSSLKLPPILIKECHQQFPESNDYFICLRSGMASLSAGKLFKSLQKGKVDPQFHTPDTRIVKMTNYAHPPYQCRLDTFFQGSLCSVDYRIDLSAKSDITGACHAQNGHTKGLRPRCWYRP